MNGPCPWQLEHCNQSSWLEAYDLISYLSGHSEGTQAIGLGLCLAGPCCCHLLNCLCRGLPTAQRQCISIPLSLCTTHTHAHTRITRTCAPGRHAHACTHYAHANIHHPYAHITYVCAHRAYKHTHAHTAHACTSTRHTHAHTHVHTRMQSNAFKLSEMWR